jgi:hypothetical protein
MNEDLYPLFYLREYKEEIFIAYNFFLITIELTDKQHTKSLPILT